MDLFSGLVGLVIGSVVSGLLTYKAALDGAEKAFANQLKLREADRLSKIQGCLTSRVLFEGTYYLSNRAGEAVMLRVVQKRLFENLKSKPATDLNVEKEITRRIASGKANDIATSVRTGNTKLDSSVLGTDDEIEVSECEMYGYLAEDIILVIIGTLISISTLDGKVKTERLYLHRFVMGGPNAPDPKARWHQFHSAIVA
jgi:hypothetical protein